MDALSEFNRAVTAYEIAAVSAYTDLYQWSGKTKTAAMQRYENESYGEFLAALQRLRHRYEMNPSGKTKVLRLMDELLLRHEERHSLYDKLVDYQLDSESQNHDLWRDAHKRRNDFSELLDETKRLKQEIISAVEHDITETE